MKRKRRLKLVGRSAVYHCISRTVGGQFLLDDEAKAVFRKQMWQVADFCGLRILTYCLMSNHFHILVEVPDREKASVMDAELLRRYRVLYPKPTEHQQASIEVLEEVLAAGGKPAEERRAGLLRRMHDVSEFMQTLKQRFSVWYNRSHERFGTVWAERFTSVLVEKSAPAVYTVGRYIDLNPVRAGLVEDPKEYRFCGYGEAQSGGKLAQAGILRVVSLFQPKASQADALSIYEFGLFGDGMRGADGKKGKINREAALKVIRERGNLPAVDALQTRVRYFSSGAAIGSRDFVDEVAGRGRRRAVRMKGAQWDGLYAKRDLQTRVFE